MNKEIVTINNFVLNHFFYFSIAVAVQYYVPGVHPSDLTFYTSKVITTVNLIPI